jgi:NADP-dependent aldehyde dehydrogenase
MNRLPTFQAVNPATGEKLPGEFRDATTREIAAACANAATAFESYGRLSGPRRAEFLEAVGEEVLRREEPLKARIAAETAYPEARILAERDRTVLQLRMFAALLREGSWVRARLDFARPDRFSVSKPDIRQYQIPLGPVAVFGASNFPQAYSTAGGDTASVLAAGCPVVVKAHPAHPGTAELYAEAIRAAAKKTGMPEGVFSQVHGLSHEVGQALVRDPNIKAVGFTGSFRGGKALFDAAAQRPEPIPVYAEMGSNNPVFLLPEALRAGMESLAEGMAKSITLGAGQFCTCPGLAVNLGNADGRAFTGLLQEKLRAMPSGTLVHASIKKGYEAALGKKLESPGVELLFQGENHGAFADTEAQPALLRIAAANFLKNREMGEEIFGPASMVVACDSKEEMLEVARSLAGQLTATVHGTENDLRQHAELFEILKRKAGRVIVNGYPTGLEVCPSIHHGGPYLATTFPQWGCR